MSEQANNSAQDASTDRGERTPDQPQTPGQDEVRTAGETSVDDALGSADDPR